MALLHDSINKLPLRVSIVVLFIRTVLCDDSSPPLLSTFCVQTRAWHDEDAEFNAFRKEFVPSASCWVIHEVIFRSETLIGIRIGVRLYAISEIQVQEV